MKYSIQFLIGLLLLILNGNNLWAHDVIIENFIVDGIAYNNIGNNELEVVHYGNGGWMDYSGTIVIPNHIIYNDVEYTVTSIGEFCFANYPGINEVVLPNTLQIIEQGAFMNCLGLKEIIIPNSVIEIGNEAFENCPELISAKMGDSLKEVGIGIFKDCSALVDVQYSTSLAKVPDQTFKGCTSLKKINLPNNIVTIGKESFANCKQLEELELPNSLIEISNGAFSSCSSLMDITIPESVKTLEENVFGGCSSLTNFVIPNSVTYLGEGSFANCSNLRNITLSNSLTTIKSNTFTDCYELKQIELPNSITTIEDYGFRYCVALEEIKFSDSLTSIGAFAFERAFALNNIEFPKTLTLINEYAFDNCTALKSITCLAINPPTCGRNVFYNVPKKCVLYVPVGSLVTYRDTYPWKEFDINGISNDEDPVPEIPSAIPEKLYIMGDIENNYWNPLTAIEADSEVDGVFTFNRIVMNNINGTNSLFTFINVLSSDWNLINDGTHRYGPIPGEDNEIKAGDVVKFACGGDLSFNIPNGTYSFTLDFNSMEISVSEEESGVDTINIDNKENLIYYNTQGMEVSNPEKGRIYIVKQGNKTYKVFLR